MRKGSFYLLLFISFLLILPKPSFANEEQAYIVLFNNEIDEQLIEASGSTVIETTTNSPIALILADEAGIAKIRQSSLVKSVEADHKIAIAAQETSWGIESAKIPLAWQSGYTGKGVKIAVIDSGIGPHDDLKVVKKVSFLESDSSDVDYNGHGTHIAGIIAALDNDIGVKGIAPDAELYALKVFNKEGIGFTFDIIKAIDWAIENEMDIINLSLTSKVGLPAYEEIINRAYAKGSLLVAAAGNSTETDIHADTVEYPARYTNAIAVASVDQNNKKGYYSAIGPTVEVSAPGVNIYSTYTDNQYNTLSGTSVAAASITGQLALLKEAYPHLNNVQLRKKLIDLAVDIGPKGKDPVFGYGLVQTSAYEKPLYEYPALNNPATKLTFSQDYITEEVGKTVQVKLIATFKNGQTLDVSDFVRWQIKNENIAKSRGNRIDLQAVGQTTLHATYADLAVELPIEVINNGSLPPSKASPFVDLTEDHWAFDAILEMQKKLIITGYENQTFLPENHIQRQHVAAMLGRTLKLEKKKAISPFYDVSMESPYFYDIVRTQQAGIFKGNEHRFGPYESLTRGQMAKILVETFNLPKSMSHPFPDVTEVHWAHEYVATLYQEGITTGSNGQFKPEDPVTRAEFAVFIHRVMK